MNKQAPKKIRIIKVDEKELYELAIFRKVTHSRAGAMLVKLKPQQFEGINIPKTEIWVPPSAYITNESTQPIVVVRGIYLNPFLKSLQIRLL